MSVEGGPAELHWRVYDESLASLGDPVEHTLADHKGCYLELFAVVLPSNTTDMLLKGVFY